MAIRMKANPLAVFQNLYIVYGKPGWSATFVISSINSGGRFTPLRFETAGEQGKDTWGFRAVATDKDSGEKLEGPWVTWAMAKAEGWVEKNGSKWKTMPELMFRYRSATFWGRLYCPEVLMGMSTQDELVDIGVEARIAAAKPVSQPNPETNEKLFGKKVVIQEPDIAPAPTPKSEPKAKAEPAKKADVVTDVPAPTREEKANPLEEIDARLAEAGISEADFESWRDADCEGNDTATKAKALLSDWPQTLGKINGYLEFINNNDAHRDV